MVEAWLNARWTYDAERSHPCMSLYDAASILAGLMR